MFIKKNTIFCSVLFITFFAFASQTLGVPLPRNGNDFPKKPNIYTRKDLNSQESSLQTVKEKVAEQIELLKKKKAELLEQQNSSTQLSPEEIFSITAYLAIIEQQIIDEQAKIRAHCGQQDNAQYVPVSETELQQNIAQDHWNTTELIAYARELKLSSRKALLDKLMQTNRTLKTNARRLKSYVYTPKTQLQTVPVIATADSLFALAAGSIIIEKLVVPAATLATGLYVGSGNHDSNNSPVPQTPAPQAATPPANTPAAAPRANVPSANSTATYSSTKFANPHTKPASSHTKAVPKEPAREPKKAPQKTFKEPTFKKDPAFLPADNFSQSDNAKRAVQTFQAQKAHDRARRDQVVETAASVFACGLQQYDQRQKSARRAKIIAEDAKRKEEDIQQRMRAGSKSRWQIEEEDRLFLERVEQNRKEQARIEQENQQKERDQAARKKEDKKKEKLDRKSKKPKQKGVQRTSNSGPGQDPDDDKDKKDKNKGPYGIYENNPKHHQNSRENIGKPPRDGQKMLDSSKSVPGEKYRINIENNKFVMLKEHSSGKWHGYIVEKFTDLPPDARNALWNAGLVKNPTNGKIK